MKLIGLDIGTTGCKAVLFEQDGTVVGKAAREYFVDIPRPNWAEQDAENVWRLAQETLRELMTAAERPEVAAIGLSVQGEAVMPVDEEGRALRPMILGMDTRTGPQNKRLVEQFGAKALFEKTGMPVHTINTLPKLLWIKENEPEIWKRACRFVLYEDYLLLMMTGRAAISQCLASRTQLYDIHRSQWSEEILAALGLDPSRLSEVLPPGTVVEAMRADLAESLGFRRPPLVVTGGHDQACGALGVGLTRPGLAEVSSGTAEVVEVAMTEPRVNQTLFKGNISVYAHAAPGLYVTMTLNHSGGILLRWFRDTFGEVERQQANATGQDAYDLLLQDVSQGPTGLYVLPHFAGSGTPTFDTASKGAILGLTLATKKADLAKAILEGLTYELRVNLDLLKAGGVQIDTLRAIGGGAKSDLWLQLKADILGIPVLRPRITEAASWGAALLAGTGAGIFPNAAEAAEQSVQFDQEFQPDASRQAAYQRCFEVYKQLYPTLASLSHQI